MSVLLWNENQFAQYNILFTVTGIDNNSLPWNVIGDMKWVKRGEMFIMNYRALTDVLIFWI